MTKRSPFKYFKTSPEIIRLAVMLYVRLPLSVKNVEQNWAVCFLLLQVGAFSSITFSTASENVGIATCL